MSDPIHFENLWEAAEKIASNKYGKLNDNEIMNELTLSITAYEKALTTDLSDDIRNEFKKRILGHMVFIMTAISAKENINVYAVLKEEMDIMEFDLKNS